MSFKERIYAYLAAHAASRRIRHNTLAEVSFAVVGTALLATLLAILATAVYETWIPSSLVGNLTYGELGIFAALAAAVAFIFYYRER